MRRGSITDAAARLVRDVEPPAVGRQLDVDRQPADARDAGHPHTAEVDLRHHTAELARGEHVPAIRREVEVVHAQPRDPDAPLEPPATGIPHVEALEALGDHDGLRAVGREVEVVRVVHGDRLRRLRLARIQDHQRVSNRVGHIQAPQVPARRHVVRHRTDGKAIDHAQTARVDDIDGAGVAVRHVDALGQIRQRPAHI
jgi:hypothetical protein